MLDKGYDGTFIPLITQYLLTYVYPFVASLSWWARHRPPNLPFPSEAVESYPTGLRFITLPNTDALKLRAVELLCYCHLIPAPEADRVSPVRPSIPSTLADRFDRTPVELQWKDYHTGFNARFFGSGYVKRLSFFVLRILSRASGINGRGAGPTS